MNWDRWKDSNWVRWHKLLPEKQGGWQFVPLIEPAAPVEAIPGSPVLLLHFDGGNGQTGTVDSSPYNWPVTMNTTISGLGLTTSNPKFGTASLALPTFNPIVPGAVVTVPLVLGGPLDVFALAGGWTIECFFLLESYGAGTGTPLFLFDYAANIGSPESSDFTAAIYNVDGAGTWMVSVDVDNMFTGEGDQGITQNFTLALNTWHHFAICNNGTTTTVYLDGVALTVSRDVWNASNYDNLNEATYVNVGGSPKTSTETIPGQVDELRVTPLPLYFENFTPPTAANTIGVPNTLGTPVPPSGVVNATYLGVARAVCDWSSIDGQFWIAIGTNLKLYVVNAGGLYDITPSATSSNLFNTISVTEGSNIVTVTDVNNVSSTGNFVDIIGANAVGGIALEGEYQITVLTPTTWTVTAAQTASETTTGGGSFTVNYDIGPGLPADGELLGYGTGPYGTYYFGTPRPLGVGVPGRMRTWSLDNYGEDLIASYSDGEIYWWQRAQGPNTPAQIIPLAPTGCQRVLVDAQQRVIIAFGCTDEFSNYDSMLIRWCSFDDITDWVETDVNTAGSDLLTAGSRIITAVKTKGQNLIWTDTTLYRQVFVGGTDEYDHYPAGQCTIVGPNAAVDVDGVAYFMGFDNFYNYSGTLNLQSCDVWETVFDPNNPNSLLKSQAEGVVAYTYEPKTEITWLYPSIGGVFTITFTEALAQGATSGTLSTAWTGASGIYDMEFPDQEWQAITLLNGETTAQWELPLTLGVAGTATFIGNDRYVTYNWEDGTWFYGQWYRTVARGRAPAMNGYPYGCGQGYLYQHEIGTDAVESAGTVAIGWYMKSLDITVGGAKSEYTMGGSDARFAIGGSDAHLLMRSFIPDWVYFTGAMNLTVSTKDRPQETNYVVDGPVAFSADTAQIDIDAHGSQLVLQLDNYTGTDGAPSLGSSFRMGILQGMAVPYAKR